MSTGLAVFIFLAVTWAGVMLLARKTNYLEKYSLSPYGPFLMWRTEKGKKLIDRISAARTFWKGYGYFSIAFTFFAMAVMTSLLLWIATIIPSVPQENAPSLRLILGIPGINPVIPLWQGILGLLVGVGVHEMAHGIATRAHRLKLVSLGLLFAWVPMGAFAEPDEGSLQSARKLVRMSVYAVGPASNFILAAVCVLLFAPVMMGSLAPVHDAPISLHDGQFAWGEQVISVNGTALSNPGDLDNLALTPGVNYSAVTYRDGAVAERNVTAGLFVIGVFDDSPAAAANLTEGMIILAVENRTVSGREAFSDILDTFSPGDRVNMTVMDTGRWDDTSGSWNTTVVAVTLADEYEYYNEHYPASADATTQQGEAFVGVFISYMGGPFADSTYLLDIYTHPYRYNTLIRGSLAYVGMPLQGLSPVPDPVKELYEPAGVWGAIPEPLFYVIADGLYWIFWISVMVGLTNALPAFPLDGGVIFSDGLDWVLARLLPGVNNETRSKMVNNIAIATSLLMLALVLWQFLGPHIIPLLPF